jgi:3-deoxy-D-manno-octulosonic-acid transferase
MPRALYSLLLGMLLPLLAVAFWWRGFRTPAYRGSVRGHLALGLAPRADRPLWLHAASVGEVQALAPLVGALRAAMPDLPLLLTVATPTGLRRARDLYAQQGLTLLPAPWDLPGVARRFMATQQPCAGVFIENEMWPNLVAAAGRARAPLLLASARVSARSCARYHRWMPAVMRQTVRGFARIGAQSDADGERFVSLGADPAAVQRWGNLKFDLHVPDAVRQQGLALRAQLAPSRPMWVAGSTHPGEEAMCLASHCLLRDEARQAGRPAPLLVMAPRRPERFEEVARWLESMPVTHVRHDAALARPDLGGAAGIDIVLVDRLGELLPYYAAADVAFVGGSLVPVGGHNLLEPAALATPVLAGPHTGNAPDVAQSLESAGGMRRVADQAALTQALRELFGDAPLARRMGECAAAAVAAHGGATARALAAITALPAVAGRPASPAAATGWSAGG